MFVEKLIQEGSDFASDVHTIAIVSLPQYCFCAVDRHGAALELQPKGCCAAQQAEVATAIEIHNHHLAFKALAHDIGSVYAERLEQI